MSLLRRAFTGEQVSATGTNVVVAFAAVLLPVLALLASWWRGEGAWVVLSAVLTVWLLVRAVLLWLQFRAGDDEAADGTGSLRR
jgi:fatty acid desaturase